jgi:hypothetical protein
MDLGSGGLKVVKVMDKEGDGSWIFARKFKVWRNWKISKAMDLGFLSERASCWNLELSETRYQKKKPKSYGSWILF